MNDSQLAALYRGAELLVLPSVLEGFGLPVIEAMASGTPVVAARSSCLPEIAGSAAVFVDPLDSTDIRRGMEYVLGSAGFDAPQLREQGLLRVRADSHGSRWRITSMRIVRGARGMLDGDGTNPLKSQRKRTEWTSRNPQEYGEGNGA